MICRERSALARLLKTTQAILAVSISITLTGCISDRMYQPVGVREPAVALNVYTPPLKNAPNPPATDPANHVTVEFRDDRGEYADSDCAKLSGIPCQIDFAEMFIKKARQQADTDQKDLVVLTFIHGNENNASRKYDNYPHFEQLINCLNLGEADYFKEHQELFKDHDPDDPLKQFVSCKNVTKPIKTEFVGVYIGWRGRRNITPINLQQGAAMRIGKAHDLVKALFRLRDAAKEPSLKPARFLVIGHSFGGLMLEQAASQIYTSAYKSTDSDLMQDCNSHSGPARGYKPFTDLVVTLNEAVNSVPAKHLIDFLRTKPTLFCHSDQLASALDRPILIGIHSKSDVLTGKTGTVLRSVLISEGGFHPGTFPLDKSVYQNDPGWYLQVRSTPANLYYFQNLCYIDRDPITNRTRTGNDDTRVESDACVLVQSDVESSPRRALAVLPTVDGDTTSPINHLYVRYDCRGGHTTSADSTPDPEKCSTPDPSQDQSDLHIWNTTPYWLVSVDDSVVSGHSDLWNDKIVKLLSGISLTQEPLSQDGVIPKRFVPAASH